RRWGSSAAYSPTAGARSPGPRTGPRSRPSSKATRSAAPSAWTVRNCSSDQVERLEAGCLDERPPRGCNQPPGSQHRPRPAPVTGEAQRKTDDAAADADGRDPELTCVLPALGILGRRAPLVTTQRSQEP